MKTITDFLTPWWRSGVYTRYKPCDISPEYDTFDRSIKVEEFQDYLNTELKNRIAKDHLGQNSIDTLHWMNQWMKGQFKSCSLGHTVLNLRYKQCRFDFDSTSRCTGTLSVIVDPSFGMVDIQIETPYEKVEFAYLLDALDWWSGKITLRDIAADNYDHKETNNPN